uniref:Uncharacterized protein n=1 Tax=Glossina palpalis gambiensis TaxID=67801 RepID=A0A1B0AYV2_9MUSC
MNKKGILNYGVPLFALASFTISVQVRKSEAWLLVNQVHDEILSTTSLNQRTQPTKQPNAPLLANNSAPCAKQLLQNALKKMPKTRKPLSSTS